MSHGGGHSGGHDGGSGHSGHYGHDSAGHYGHDGAATLGSLLGLGGMDTMISHALGLDGSHHSGGHHSGHTLPSGHEAQLPWVPINTTQPGSVVSRILGIRIGSWFWLFMFFIGFMLWLILISFIRHHEPNAKQIFENTNNTSTAEVSKVNRMNSNTYLGTVNSYVAEPVTKTSPDMQLYGKPDPIASSDPITSDKAFSTSEAVSTSTSAPAFNSHVMYKVPVRSQTGPKIRIQVSR